jgi:hypothetical protein
MLMQQIYMYPNLKTFIVQWFISKNIITITPTPPSQSISVNADQLNLFIIRTYDACKLNNDKIRETRANNIIHRFKLMVDFQQTDLLFSSPKQGIVNANSQNFDHIDINTCVFDLFFIIYLKGGMATRFICLFLNTLTKSDNINSSGGMFTKEMLDEHLGDISDYDFNCSINPLLISQGQVNEYEILRQTIESIIKYTFEQFMLDPFFTNHMIIQEVVKTAAESYYNYGTDTGSLSPSNEHIFFAPTISDTNPTQRVGTYSYVPIPNLFTLSRLMLEVHLKYRDDSLICYKVGQNGQFIQNKSIKLLAELIDISCPDINNYIETHLAWEYANSAIELNWCDALSTQACNIGQPNTYNNIRVYSLNSVLDDLTHTINESLARGDSSKVEKRKKRVEFFRNLICEYTLIIDKFGILPTQTDEIKNYCTDFTEKLCVDDYIDDDVSVVVGSYAVGLPQDTNLILKIVIKYLLNIISSFKLSEDIEFEKHFVTHIGSINQERENMFHQHRNMDTSQMSSEAKAQYFTQLANTESTFMESKLAGLKQTTYDEMATFERNKQQLYQLYNENYTTFLTLLEKPTLEYIKTTVIALLCRLVITSISLKKSLNDNFIQDFINFKFLSILNKIMNIFLVVYPNPNTVLLTKMYEQLVASTSNDSVRTTIENEFKSFEQMTMTDTDMYKIFEIIWKRYDINKMVSDFNKDIITTMEYINSINTRPYIHSFFNTYLECISEAIYTTYGHIPTLLEPNSKKIECVIRGGCAVHLNLAQFQGTSQIQSNDIDIVINIPPDPTKKMEFVQRLQYLLDKKITHHENIKLKHYDYGTLFQSIIYYPNSINDHLIINEQIIACNQLFPYFRHHVLEINFVSALNILPANNLTMFPDNYYKNFSETIYPNLRTANPQLPEKCPHILNIYFCNSQYLLKEYNKIILETKHWYRKFKYLFRICALNGLIVDYNARKLLESEFPLPC